jgi:hypothetical protein
MAAARAAETVSYGLANRLFSIDATLTPPLRPERFPGSSRIEKYPWGYFAMRFTT